MGFLRDIQKDINRDASIYMVVHEHPDGDAVGSQVALTLYLRSLGWKAFMVRAEQISTTYDYFTKDVPVRCPEAISDNEDNVFIALDCSKTMRLPESMRSRKYHAVIDHHPEETPWSTYRKIDVTASSACELLMSLLTEDGYKLDNDNPKIAFCVEIEQEGVGSDFWGGQTCAPVAQVFLNHIFKK